jgi:hypothetical protein
VRCLYVLGYGIGSAVFDTLLPLAIGIVVIGVIGFAAFAVYRVSGTTNGDYVVSVAGTGTQFDGANCPRRCPPCLMSAAIRAPITSPSATRRRTGARASYSSIQDYFGIAAVEVFPAASGQMQPVRNVV